MSSEETPNASVAEIVLIGCGCPLRGMGWYHAVQLLEGLCPNGKLVAVVEPWFLGAGAESKPGIEFKEWSEAVVSKHPDVEFRASLADVSPSKTGRRMALISGRTADNPRLLTECIAQGINTVYLEKPGAPTVSELEAMESQARDANVSVLMGYNKNVCKYVSRVREFASSNPSGHVTFVSNNTYEDTPESLGECFERNKEGMLKNMAIHELALLVSFYNISVSSIASVSVDRTFSSMQTLKGPSGSNFTDFDKVKFTVTTLTGSKVSVQADRCGGNVSYATVTDEAGDELFRYSMPDEEDQANVERLKDKYPNAMDYFFTQDKDYIALKDRVAAFAAGKTDEAEGVASIKVAVDTLKLAEHLEVVIKKDLA